MAAQPRVSCVVYLLACAALTATTLGQEPDHRRGATNKPPEFEVATIKPHPGRLRFFTIAMPAGRLEATNVTARQLVALAFNVSDDQVSGEPDWAGAQHFDVVAKIDDAQWAEISQLDSLRQSQAMQIRLQALLRERFRLEVIHKPKKLPVYVLIVSRGGSRLQPHGTQKTKEPADASEKLNVTTLALEDAQVPELVNLLSMHFHRAVIDRTGLLGHYDIRLQIALPDGGTQEDADAAFAKALESQLGLRLVLRRETVDTIEILHLDPPSEN